MGRHAHGACPGFVLRLEAGVVAGPRGARTRLAWERALVAAARKAGVLLAHGSDLSCRGPAQPAGRGSGDLVN